MNGLIFIIPQTLFFSLIIFFNNYNGQKYLLYSNGNKLKLWKLIQTVDSIIVLLIFIIFREKYKLCYIIFFVNFLLSITSLEILNLIEKKHYFALLKKRIENLPNITTLSIHEIKIELLKKFDMLYDEKEIIIVLKNKF